LWFLAKLDRTRAIEIKRFFRLPDEFYPIAQRNAGGSRKEMQAICSRMAAPFDSVFTRYCSPPK
jgi:hypothetical protein